ncbi:MAG: calcium-translocating P-type ATPase, SERCA-type [Sebaldella sp.]|nr:calcium-translocating P-type ATPase, SERCA-type [Sebaldella sp.]
MEKKKWYDISVEDTVKILNTDLQNGLTSEEVTKRIEENGYNELIQKKKKTFLEKFLAQFKDFMIIVLIFAALVSGIVGVLEHEGINDSIIILLIVIVNAIIGVMQENKAEKSLEALKKLSSHTAKVLRNGHLLVLPARELVPGDVIILETGDYITADLRLTEAINLRIEEASLTGESVPVEKITKLLAEEDLPLGDRENLAFSTSLVSYGRGKGIVVETGMNTEVGNIATILDSTENSQTPLQKKLDGLGKLLGTAALIICFVMFIIGTINGKEPMHMFLSAVSLAVAAIPEGLPAIATIVLAIGVQRMVTRHAIVKRLPCVETLGSTTVVCSDKTGTLTQNKMTVEKLYLNNEILDVDSFSQNNIPDDVKLLITASILCNDSKIGSEDGQLKITGDPTETALIDLGLKFSLNKNEIEESEIRVDELPFDSERKLMSTVNKYNDNNYRIFTKGAVDELLKRCDRIFINGKIREIDDKDIENILEANNNLAKDALRVLGMAYKDSDSEVNESLESNLIYIGMVGMIDPPRPEVKSAIEKCKTAGIKTVMITGDHKITAIAIAKALGILEDESEATTGPEVEKMTQEELENHVKHYRVYARVSPEHKVRIVKAWQKHGDIVAMTGDGVNDAPALKTADIGAAMGIVGTDVSKEAADIILTDDNFATIVAAVEEGRRIYDNILKAIQFLLSSNIGEIITLFFATLVNWQEPLIPIHILWVNLITDSLPALALSFDPAEDNIMKRRPIPANIGIFTKGRIYRVGYQGLMIGTLTLLAYRIGIHEDPSNVVIGQTMAFAVLSLSQLVHVFNIRSKTQSIFKTGVFSNMYLVYAVLISFIMMIAVLFIPFLQNIFKVVTLSPRDILIVAGLSFMPLIIVEIFKLLKINAFKNED